MIENRTPYSYLGGGDSKIKSYVKRCVQSRDGEQDYYVREFEQCIFVINCNEFRKFNLTIDEIDLTIMKTIDKILIKEWL